eukprot:scaffold28869_cov66-Phaeocystis_antarctica.AAC.2
MGWRWARAQRSRCGNVDCNNRSRAYSSFQVRPPPLVITATPQLSRASALPPELSGEEAIKLVRVRPRAHAGALAVPRAARHVPSQFSSRW